MKQKEAYTAPVLVKYETIRDITAATSAGQQCVPWYWFGSQQDWTQP